MGDASINGGIVYFRHVDMLMMRAG